MTSPTLPEPVATALTTALSGEDWLVIAAQEFQTLRRYRWAPVVSPPRSISADRERERKARKRAKEAAGLMCVRELWLPEVEVIDTLIESGFLPASMADDRQAIRGALVAMILNARPRELAEYLSRGTMAGS